MKTVYKDTFMKQRDTLVKCLLVSLMAFAMGFQKAEAQLLVTPGDEITGWTADSLVRNILLSGGVTVSNVRFNGMSEVLVCNNIGRFETGLTQTNLGIESGLIIATGPVTEAVGPNNDDGVGDIPSCSDYFDQSLANLATGMTNDMAVLEFDFVPWDSLLSFNYVFGSEEYPEFVDGEFNDVFAFFVDGINPNGGSYNNTNMALVPGTNEVVSINTVNDHHNAEYYIDNTGGRTIQYDGFTVLMNVSFNVVPMTEYHIKMGICDLVDTQYDSGVFLEANSFQSTMSYTILMDEMYYMNIPDGYVFCTNHAIDFDTETSWNFDDVIWYFGDGTSAQGRHVQHTYTEDGFYEVMNVLHNPHRATDSLYLSKVIEVRSQHVSEEAFTCNEEPYFWHGMQLTETGVYSDTLVSSMGCDSIVTLNLTVGDVFLTDTIANACETFTWYGQTYQTTGLYEHAFQTTMGCDSLVRLHLTISHAVETDTVAATCGAFTWYGQTYQTSGQYERLFQTTMGCDSIVRLHLTISHAMETDTVAVTCEPFTWYGQTCQTTGQYEHVFQTTMGCDSIVRLHLTIEQVRETDTMAIACEAFAWHGQTYESSGDYVHLFQSYLGCDSLVHLHLTLNHPQKGALQGPKQVIASSNIISVNYDYYVPDSLSIVPNTLHWSCTHPDWIVSPCDNRYRCHLWVTNIGQGTLIARTEHDCDTVYSIDINATWFDLEENEGVPVKIFPNPAQTEVTIQTEGIGHIRIIDIIGQVWMEKDFAQTDAACLNISHMPQGVYVVEITTMKGKTARRLVVSR